MTGQPSEVMPEAAAGILRRMLLQVHDEVVGAMEAASATREFGGAYETVCAEVEGEGLILVARGAAAARVKDVLAAAQLARPQVMTKAQARQLRADHALVTDPAPGRDPRVAYCKGGAAVCEICVGSCGIEEYLQEQAKPTVRP